MPDYDFENLPISRAEKARMAKDALRQQERRQNMRERRAPETHAVDRAISQGTARVTTRALRRGADEATVTIRFAEIGAEAVQILCYRYGREASTLAVAARLRPGDRHLDPLPRPRGQEG